MKQIKLTEEVSLSQLVQGIWRLIDWNYSDKELIDWVTACYELGIDTFDHADIYGDYQCEQLFGKALSLHPELNKKLKIVTKCGIKLVSSNRPQHYIKHYDTSAQHIISSVETSLKNLHREQIDLLLLHRPDPLIDPEEVASAFSQLKEQGKVKAFGVSNFTPSQCKALQAYVEEPLATNQIEISVAALEHFENGTIDFCQERGLRPMAWSPLAGGAVFKAETHRFLTLKNILHKLSKNLNASIDQIMFAWLLNHPVGILPILGTGKMERIKAATQALDIQLSRQQWFEIWVASKGEGVP